MAITPINTIKNWFKTALKPTQEQFWAWMDSFWHKDDQIPQSSVQGLTTAISGKANTSDLVSEIQARESADNNLSDWIACEESQRQGADSVINQSIVALGNVINTEATNRINADNALDLRLQDQEHETFDSADSGLVEFNTTDNNVDLWSVTGSVGSYVFNLLVGGHGRIKGVIVNFNSGQSVNFATSYNCLFCCINAQGQLITTSVVNYATMFPLWQLFTGDSGAWYVGWEGHPYSFTSNVSAYMHRIVGTVISGSGGNIAAVSPQSGATLGHLAISGDALFEDHGLTTTISNSAGVGVTFIQDILKSTGVWSAYANQQQLLPRYNHLDVATAIPIGKNGAFLIYAAKGDGKRLTTSARFLCLAQNKLYNTAEIALSDLNAFFAGQTTTILPADGLLTTIEVCLLGGIVMNDAGSIVNVVVNKKTLSTGQSGGNASLAAVAYSGEHSQTINQNSDINYQHITSAEKTKYNESYDSTLLTEDTPVDADVFSFYKIASSVRKKITWLNLVYLFESYFIWPEDISYKPDASTDDYGIVYRRYAYTIPSIPSGFSIKYTNGTTYVANTNVTAQTRLYVYATAFPSTCELTLKRV